MTKLFHVVVFMAQESIQHRHAQIIKQLEDDHGRLTKLVLLTNEDEEVVIYPGQNPVSIRRIPG